MGEDRDRPPGPATAAAPRYRYTSPDEDSARWWDFPFRPGDIVVSTRSKSGTTWVQMICLLLVYGTPDLPDRLGALSPWLDHLVRPKEEVFARLAAQGERRVIKTHTPLDGVPLDDRVTYIVVGRHPLDVAVSLYHHGENIDRRRMAELTGNPETERPAPPPLHEWLLGFIDWDGDPREWLDTLPGAMLHLSDAWGDGTTPTSCWCTTTTCARTSTAPCAVWPLDSASRSVERSWPGARPGRHLRGDAGALAGVVSRHPRRVEGSHGVLPSRRLG